MSKRFTIVTVALAATVSFLVGLILAGGLAPATVVSTAPAALPKPAGLARPAVPPGATALVNFADVAERINPAVVNIEATTTAVAARDPQRYFRRRPDAPGEGPFPRDFDTPAQGSGSGFVIDREGFILTNNHVIEAAERITVTLADGRTFRAEIVGADPAIDVALLRIEGARDLPEAPLGNSDALRVGEWVCAIGNPLGYVHSVTVGVVSFIGRQLFDPSLDAYIQTDAAINFGNSGGPLINSRGEVIGINSAISARASSIGFAVPINQAVAILPQLKTTGRVSRGFMGVTLIDVTPPLQRALGLSVSHGAMIQDVSPRSPAERAGLRPYDVILEVEGQPVTTNQELIQDISARQPGSVTRLEVLRDGRRQVLPVKLAERPGKGSEFDSVTPAAPGGPPRSRPAPPDGQVPLGLFVREMDRTFIGRLEIPDSVQGVIVSRVDPTGSAYQVLRRHFVIMEINRQPTRTIAEYQRLAATWRPRDVLAVYYYDPTLGQRGLVTVMVD
ncbi:MAG TPA: trypsin-like peptidase domain-containing protein [Vicinamibacterales bacterium]|nr:trypsin-like peptidase domain-containing protein [Vicinamibacterales bacterium]